MPHKDPEARRAYRAAYYAAHPEKTRAARVRYQVAHRERLRLRSQVYRAAHPEKNREQCAKYAVTHAEKLRAYRTEHSEQIRVRGATYCTTHPEKTRARHAAYRTAHPEKGRVNNANRRARTRGVGGRVTAAEWAKIKAHYNHRCVYCGKKMARLTQDHLTPISKGGKHEVMNIVPACGSCNSRKGNRNVLTPVQPLLLL